MQQKKLLTFFQELECPNLGPKTIQTLYDNGFHTVLDILDLTKQDLLNTEKFKDKSSENVLLGIKVAKDFLANGKISMEQLEQIKSASFVKPQVIFKHTEVDIIVATKRTQYQIQVFQKIF